MSDLKDRIAGLSPEKRAQLEKRLMERGRAGAGAAVIRPRGPGDPNPLSFAQQRLWFLDQLDPGSSTYNVPYSMRIEGPVDAGALRRALDEFVRRHEVLRTRFVAVRGNPVCLVAKTWPALLTEVDLRGVPAEAREAEVARLVKKEAARPFNLARDVVFRTSLFRVGDEAYVFSLVSHHIAWDLRSKVIFYSEIGPLYDAFKNGRASPLPPLVVQYADYAFWQRKHLAGPALDALIAYWKQQLGGAKHTLDLPADKPRPPAQSLRGAKLAMGLPEALIEAAKAFSRKSGNTLYMTFLAAFTAFLHAYTGQDDISVGSPTAGRNQVETEAMVGFFINTVVLRTRLDATTTFRELALRVRETTLGALAHQELPFEKVVEVLRPPRDMSRMALFQVNFRVQAPPLAPLDLAGTRVLPLEIVDNDTSKFDLALEVPTSEAGSGYFEYSTDLFEEATIATMGRDFAAILREAIEAPEQPIGELPAVAAIRRRDVR